MASFMVADPPVALGLTTRIGVPRPPPTPLIVGSCLPRAFGGLLPLARRAAVGEVVPEARPQRVREAAVGVVGVEDVVGAVGADLDLAQPDGAERQDDVVRELELVRGVVLE